MLVIGLVSLSITSAFFLLVDLETSLWWIRVIMFLRGASMSFAVVAAQAATFSTITSQETGRASALFNTNRQVASSVGVAVLSTALAEAMAFYDSTAEGGLLAFHDAFAVSIVFGILGIFFALRIHDEDAAATFTKATQREPSTLAAAAAHGPAVDGRPRGTATEPVGAPR